jgi:hypothetical protein
MVVVLVGTGTSIFPHTITWYRTAFWSNVGGSCPLLPDPDPTFGKTESGSDLELAKLPDLKNGFESNCNDTKYWSFFLNFILENFAKKFSSQKNSQQDFKHFKWWRIRIWPNFSRSDKKVRICPDRNSDPQHCHDVFNLIHITGSVADPDQGVIRCFFTPWTRDRIPRWFFPDPWSLSHPNSEFRFLTSKNLKVYCLFPKRKKIN